MTSFRAFRIEKTEDRQFPRSIVERRRRPARWRPPDRRGVVVAQLQGRAVGVRQQIRRPNRMRIS